MIELLTDGPNKLGGLTNVGPSQHPFLKPPHATLSAVKWRTATTSHLARRHVPPALSTKLLRSDIIRNSKP